MANSKLKELPNYNVIRGFQTRRVKQLNDFYIEVQLTIKGLVELQQKLAKGNQKQTYAVPGMKAVKKQSFGKDPIFLITLTAGSPTLNMPNLWSLLWRLLRTISQTSFLRS